MKNRVRQSRTLGSVRGEVRAATVTLHGHEAGNGGDSQGNTYRSGRVSPTRQPSRLVRRRFAAVCRLLPRSAGHRHLPTPHLC